MDYEWDKKKATSNLRKHAIDFADAATVFDDLACITIEDADPEEVRFITIGMDAIGRVLVVVYTWRSDRIRLISARKATRTERATYEAAK